MGIEGDFKEISPKASFRRGGNFETIVLEDTEKLRGGSCTGACLPLNVLNCGAHSIPNQALPLLAASSASSAY